MKDLEFQRPLVEARGYSLLGDFVLPQEAWWDDYYTPMEKRVTEMEKKYASDPIAAAVVAESREEIEVYRDYADYYGYVFLVMQLEAR